MVAELINMQCDGLGNSGRKQLTGSGNDRTHAHHNQKTVMAAAIPKLKMKQKFIRNFFSKILPTDFFQELSRPRLAVSSSFHCVCSGID